MAQSVRVIDVAKTFTPVDPQIVEANNINDANDTRADRSPSVGAYEGYNFLPTAAGYKSYFGINTAFAIPPCPAGDKIDKVLIFESADLHNHLVVLSATGIYINPANVADSPWVHAAVIAAPADPNAHYPWTTCVINDTLYAYQRGNAQYWAFRKTFNGAIVEAVVPTFLNMPEQQGIFKAGGRLGFWDSANSIAWSSFDDHADFTPSITTLAGSAIFLEVRGVITQILTLGDGFVIYATNSIVQVDRDLGNTFQWNPSVLMAGTGVAYMDQVVATSPDTTHYCYTAIGLHVVEGGKIDTIATVITDTLRESIDPITVTLIENRYLCLRLTDPRMVYGLLEFDSLTHEPADAVVAAFESAVPLASLAFS